MTNSELAVLSLIVERPRHAYEIEQVITERGMRNWTEIGFSSIYYLLRKMEREGLVTGRKDTSGSRGPARVAYAPTPDGFAAWTEASLDALRTPDTSMPFLIGLSNMGALPQRRVLEAARECLAELERRLAEVEAKRDQSPDLEWFVEEAFDYSVHSLAAGRDWVAAFVKRLESRD